MDAKMDHYEDHDSFNVADMFRTVPRKQSMESRLRKSEEYDNEKMSSLWRSMGQVRFKRQADDSLALNDRLKEKLEHMMKEHVEEVSNMTCVLREMNVIDQNNNIDVSAMKKDAEQYKLPSAWFGDRYE